MQLNNTLMYVCGEMYYLCVRMKYLNTIAACSLAVIMALQSLSLLFVQLEYSVSQPYIARVLCVNRDKPQTKCEGKCFLAKELNRNASQETTNHKEIAGFNGVTLFIDDQSVYQFYPEKQSCLISYNRYFSDSGFLNSTERPPTVKG